MIDNKKEILLKKIISLTKSNEINWESKRPDYYAEFILNSNYISRLIRALYKDKYFVFSEHKSIGHGDFDETYEYPSITFFIIGNGIELIITNDDVSNDLFIKTFTYAIDSVEDCIINDLLNS